MAVVMDPQMPTGTEVASYQPSAQARAVGASAEEPPQGAGERGDGRVQARVHRPVDCRVHVTPLP